MTGAAAARQGILSLAIKDKATLYNSYMPFVKGGGIFVPTPRRYSLGDEGLLTFQPGFYHAQLSAPAATKKVSAK